MILIIDEWLWHDLSGENGSQKQKETFEFFECIYKICDKIAVMRDTPFLTKFFKLAKSSKMRGIIKIFDVYNSQKVLFLESQEDDVDLPGVKIKPDDIYLYNIYNCVEGQKCIITTDKPLIEEMKSKGIEIYHRDEFLYKYLSQCKK